MKNEMYHPVTSLIFPQVYISCRPFDVSPPLNVPILCLSMICSTSSRMDGPRSRWRDRREPAFDRYCLSSPSPFRAHFSSSSVSGLGSYVCVWRGERLEDAGSDACRDTPKFLSSRWSLGGLGGGARDGDVGVDWVFARTAVCWARVADTSAVALAGIVAGFGAGSVRACTPPMMGSEKAFFRRGELSLAGGWVLTLAVRLNWSVPWWSCCPGNRWNLPCKKDRSPKKSSAPPPLPMWMVCRKSPSGGLIMSDERRSRSFSFFPLRLLLLRYMGALADMSDPLRAPAQQRYRPCSRMNGR